MGLELLGTLGAIAAIATVVFAALKYNREDAGQVVQQQSTILGDQQRLNDRLKEALADCRAERARLEAEHERLVAAHLEMTDKFRQVEASLRAAIHQQQRLKRRLIARGENPDDHD